jgi:hypothetical protein
MMNNTITSVLGFNFNVEIRDQNDEVIRTGAKTTYSCGYKKRKPKPCILDTSFFTHYNEALLAKIRDYRRQND